MKNIPPEYLPIKLAAAKIGIPDYTLYNEYRRGNIRAIKIADKLYFRVEEIKLYLFKKECEAAGEDWQETLNGLNRKRKEEEKEYINELIEEVGKIYESKTGPTEERIKEMLSKYDKLKNKG